jgi:zinc ribbon protein
MFCNRCGKEMASGQQFCPACGAQVADDSGFVAGRVERHVQLVAILWFVYSFFTFVAGAAALIVSKTLFVELARQNDNFPGFVQPLVAAVGCLILIKAFVGFAAGWGLLQRERWARMLTLVLAFVSLLSVPFGTALGIYTLWVLLPETAAAEYDRLSNRPVSEGLPAPSRR